MTKTYKTHLPNDEPDAHFLPNGPGGGPVCEFCGKPPDEGHRIIYGKGQWKGWQRYRCEPGWMRAGA